MFIRDTFRLIKATIKRFITVMLMVFIGAGFMVGLMTCSSVLQQSVDAYNDEYDLMDIQIYSSFGFCDEDIEAIANTTSVEAVYASRFIDAYGSIGEGTTYVTRIQELDSIVNKYELVEGRLPESENEALILQGSGISVDVSIGDTIVVYLDDDDDDISDSLVNDTYTIVGIVTAPQYLAMTLETSTFHNLTLNTVIYVPNDNFISEYYTTVYVTIEGAKDELSYSDEYQAIIDAAMVDIETMALSQQDYLKEDIIAKAEAEIAEAERELEEEVAKAEAEIADGEKELEDAYQELVDAQKEVDAGWIEYNAGLEELENLYQALIAAQIENNDIWAVYYDGVAELEDAYQDLINAQSDIDAGWVEYYDGLEDLEEAKHELEEAIIEAQIEIAKAKQDIADLPEAEWTVLDRTSNYSHALFDGTIDQMASIGYVFPLLFFLVAALVCLTTMTRLIDEQRNQIGVFSALGFSKQKIVLKYLIYACLASLIGAAFGIPVGLALYPVIIYNTWRLMFYLPAMELPIDLSVIVIGTLSFTILMMAVTFFVAWRSLSERPADLLRPKAPKEGKKIMLEHITPLWKRLSFITKINSRNIFRYKARFFMTVIGVAGCTSLLVLGFGIKDSIADIIDIQYGEIFTYNETISVDEDYTDTLLAQLNADDNVTVAVSFLEYSGVVYLASEEVITIEVFNSDEIGEVVSLRDSKTGETLSISGDGIIISEKFARLHDLEVGDTITIESADGIRGDVVIDGICELYFQHYLFMSDEVYAETFGTSPLSDKIAIVSIDAEVLAETYGDLQEVESIVDFTSVVDSFENMISALDYIVIVIIFAAGSLALVVLINLSEVNISERVREIATFKVLGFFNKEVNAYIFKELLFLTIIGSIIGLPLGKIEHTFVMGVIDFDMIMYGDNIASISYVYAFMITMGFTFIVLVVMSRSIRKVKMVESLKSIE